MTPDELQLRLARAAVPNYTEGLGCDSPRYAKIRRIFERLIPGRLLDVGCADGAILGPLTGRHAISGVDICEELVKDACARGLRARIWNLENDALPYPDGFFHYVHCGETVEHVTDTDWLFAEINRVLAPGGLFVLSFPNIRTPVGLGMMLLDLPPMFSARYRSGHHRDFTLRTMKVALRNNGFRPGSARGAQFWLPFFGDCFSWLATLLPSWSASIIVIARKIGPAPYDRAAVVSDPARLKGL